VVRYLCYEPRINLLVESSSWRWAALIIRRASINIALGKNSGGCVRR